MAITIVLSVGIGLYLALFLFFEIRRRIQGKGSFFTEDHCDCKSMTSRRLLAYYRKQKKLEAKKGSKA